jgi:hypothetical protein
VKDNASFSAEVVEPTYPDNDQAVIPFSFNDYVTAIQAKRVCMQNPNIFDANPWAVTGIASQGYNWQVPFVKCDSRTCQTVGEDASKNNCEYQTLALGPTSVSDDVGRAHAESFRDFIYLKYPALVTNKPFEYAFVRVFESNQEIENYVKSSDYGTANYPKIGLAVIFSEGSSEKDYMYSIRVNSTNFNAPEQDGRPGMSTTPPPTKKFSNLANVDDVCTPWPGTAEQGPNQDSCTHQYIYNGALVIQRLLGDWIIDDSGASEKGYNVAEHGVQFVPFPTKQYTKNGFYSVVAGRHCLKELFERMLSRSPESCAKQFAFLNRLRSPSCRSGLLVPCRLHHSLDYAGETIETKRIVEDDECNRKRHWLEL